MDNEQLLELKASSDATERRTASWTGFSLERVIAAAGDSFSYQWTSDLHFCAYHDIVLEDGAIRAGDGPEFDQKDLRSTLTYIPSGADVAGWSSLTERKNGFTAIYFDPDLLSQELQHRFRGLSEANIYFYDTTVADLLKKFSALLEAGDRDDLYAETLGLFTVLNIHRSMMSRPVLRSALSRSVLGLVTDYIEENLSGSISLSDLAQVAGISRFHFHRSFRATTGETPMHYVTRRRIERAKLLLADKSYTTEQIATLVGFHDAAHLHKTFKAREGVSLRVFRKGL
jgi:AraC family transcriptional regulator